MKPALMVKLGHYMYCNLSKEKLDKIVNEHIIGANFVVECLIPEQFLQEPINLTQ